MRLGIPRQPPSILARAWGARVFCGIGLRRDWTFALSLSVEGERSWLGIGVHYEGTADAVLSCEGLVSVPPNQGRDDRFDR